MCIFVTSVKSNLHKHNSLLKQTQRVKELWKKRAAWKPRAFQLVSDMTARPAAGWTLTHENPMGHVHPFMPARVLSCHSPNVKQVQLVGSGTPVSQEARSGKMELTLAGNGNKKEALWFSTLLKAARPPGPFLLRNVLKEEEQRKMMMLLVWKNWKLIFSQRQRMWANQRRR